MPTWYWLLVVFILATAIQDTTAICFASVVKHCPNNRKRCRSWCRLQQSCNTGRCNMSKCECSEIAHAGRTTTPAAIPTTTVPGKGRRSASGLYSISNLLVLIGAILLTLAADAPKQYIRPCTPVEFPVSGQNMLMTCQTICLNTYYCTQSLLFSRDESGGNVMWYCECNAETTSSSETTTTSKTSTPITTTSTTSLTTTTSTNTPTTTTSTTTPTTATLTTTPTTTTPTTTPTTTKLTNTPTTTTSTTTPTTTKTTTTPTTTTLTTTPTTTTTTSTSTPTTTTSTTTPTTMTSTTTKTTTTSTTSIPDKKEKKTKKKNQTKTKQSQAAKKKGKIKRRII